MTGSELQRLASLQSPSARMEYLEAFRTLVRGVDPLDLYALALRLDGAVLREIGDELRVTTERARQRVKRGLERIAANARRAGMAA